MITFQYDSKTRILTVSNNDIVDLRKFYVTDDIIQELGFRYIRRYIIETLDKLASTRHNQYYHASNYKFREEKQWECSLIAEVCDKAIHINSNELYAKRIYHAFKYMEEIRPTEASRFYKNFEKVYEELKQTYDYYIVKGNKITYKTKTAIKQLEFSF